MIINDMIELESKYELACNALNSIEYINGYPNYPKEIREFMGMLVQPPWGDSSYDPSKISNIMDSIENASFNDICWVLTAANRSERFCDGSWVAILKERKLSPVFKRIKVLVMA